MRTLRRWIVSLLVGAFSLAVATPWALAHSRPGLGAYLLHPSVFLLQALPYGLAAVLLVPRWSWGSDKVSSIIAGLVLAFTLMLYVPVLSAPERWGGDMIALAFLAMSGGMMAVIVITACLAGLVRRWRRKSSFGARSEGEDSLKPPRVRG